MSVRLMIVLPLLTLLAGCGSSSSPTSPSGPTTAGTPVSIVSGASTLTTTAYAPNPVSISVGGTVTWMNNDNTTHTSSSTGNNGWNSGNIAPGASFSHTFSAAGSYQYNCTIHPNMVGTVNVQ